MNTLNYDALILQRNQIVDKISKFENYLSSFISTFVGILTLAIAVITVNEPKEITLSMPTIFFMLQIVFTSVFYVLALIQAMNNDRDSICAIDKTLEEKYNVNMFFYQGEITKELVHSTNFYNTKNRNGFNYKYILTIFILVTILMFFSLIYISIGVQGVQTR